MKEETCGAIQSVFERVVSGVSLFISIVKNSSYTGAVMGNRQRTELEDLSTRGFIFLPNHLTLPLKVLSFLKINIPHWAIQVFKDTL